MGYTRHIHTKPFLFGAIMDAISKSIWESVLVHAIGDDTALVAQPSEEIVSKPGVEGNIRTQRTTH